MDPAVWSAARLSLTLSAGAVVLAAAVGVPLGAALGLSRSRLSRVGEVVARVGMACPTVIVGLLVYGMLSRRGPLGGLDLLYTPQAIVAGEFLLALPIIAALGASSIGALDPRFGETVELLRLGPLRAMALAVGDARDGLVAALLVAFARCVGELGVALLVGGNLRGSTRTLTTAIQEETSRGDFETAVQLGIVLLAVALAVNVVAAFAFPRMQPR